MLRTPELHYNQTAIGHREHANIRRLVGYYGGGGASDEEWPGRRLAYYPCTSVSPWANLPRHPKVGDESLYRSPVHLSVGWEYFRTRTTVVSLADVATTPQLSCR